MMKEVTSVTNQERLKGPLFKNPTLTLKSENVLTQYVANSTVSSRETWMRPYVSVPLVGQY